MSSPSGNDGATEAKTAGKGVEEPKKPSGDGEANGTAEAEEEAKFVSDQYSAADRLRQQKEIEDEINKRPLVGWKEKGFDSLYEELKASSSFVRKLPFLGTKYANLRRIRGDGNCFYRGFCFRLVEEMVHDKALFVKVKQKIDTSLGYLMSVGYGQAAVEFFCEEAQRFFNEDFPKNEVELETYFANKEESMYLVWFLRLLTAGFLKHHWAERFQFFVEEHYTGVEDYCAREVEPTDKECGQIQVTALCEYFEVRTCVEYLDANANSDETVAYFFGPEKKGEKSRISLLYRPGHYDILYEQTGSNDAQETSKPV